TPIRTIEITKKIKHGNPTQPTSTVGFLLSIKAYLNLIINYFHLWFNLCLLLFYTFGLINLTR
ncbi:hypothetical protein, partial [Acinetobacter baumannii]